MDEGLLAWARAAADADGRSLSRFIERAVRAVQAVQAVQREVGHGDSFTGLPEVKRPGWDAVLNGGCDE